MISKLPQHTSVLRSSFTRPNAPQQKQPELVPGDSVSLSNHKPGIVRKDAAFLAATAAAELTAAVCFLGGALYTATVLGPIIVGACKADVGPHSLEEAVLQAQTGVFSSAMMESPSVLGSIGKEFAAPLVWGFGGAKEIFSGVYGYLAH